MKQDAGAGMDVGGRVHVCELGVVYRGFKQLAATREGEMVVRYPDRSTRNRIKQFVDEMEEENRRAAARKVAGKRSSQLEKDYLQAVARVEVDMIEEFAVLEENERLLLASFEEGFDLDSLTT